MMSKYYSEWILQLFIIWLLGYLFNIKPITKYVNPYYPSLLMSIGFTILLMYYIGIKNYNFETSFLITLMILHYVPLYVSYLYRTNKYELENLQITLLLYLAYMIYKNKNPIKVYLQDKHPSSWDEVRQLCKSTDKQFIPLCLFINNI